MISANSILCREIGGSGVVSFASFATLGMAVVSFPDSASRTIFLIAGSIQEGEAPQARLLPDKPTANSQGRRE